MEKSNFITSWQEVHTIVDDAMSVWAARSCRRPLRGGSSATGTRTIRSKIYFVVAMHRIFGRQ